MERKDLNYTNDERCLNSVETGLRRPNEPLIHQVFALSALSYDFLGEMDFYLIFFFNFLSENQLLFGL